MMSVGESAGRGLEGKRIVVTRARAQAQDLVEGLEGLGAKVEAFPLIRIVAPRDEGPLRRAARELSRYDWVAFTSVNGVERFWAVLEGEGEGAESFRGVRVGCVGPATAAALESRGVSVDLVPPVAVAESMVEAFAAVAGEGAAPFAGMRFLLPLAEGARPVLGEGLRALGAEVDRVDAYRTVADAVDAAALRRLLDDGIVDVMTFTSPSTVHAFVDSVGPETGRAVVAVIGPVTRAAARARGIPVDVEAEEHTIPGLIRALIDYFTPEPGPAEGV